MKNRKEKNHHEIGTMDKNKLSTRRKDGDKEE